MTKPSRQRPPPIIGSTLVVESGPVGVMAPAIRAERWLRLLVSGAAAAAIALDRHAIGADLLDRVHVDDVAAVSDALIAAATANPDVALRVRPRDRPTVRIDIVLRRDPGHRADEPIVLLLELGDGVGIVADAGRLAESIWQRRIEIAAAVEASPPLVVTLDVSRGTVQLSPALRERLGTTGDAPVTTLETYLARVHAEDAPVVRTALMSTDRSGIALDYRLSLDGRYRRVRDVGVCTRVRNDDAALRIGTLLEVEDLFGARDELAQLRETSERLRHELQAMSLRLVEAQEQERRHLARELHDQIGQTLTAAVLNLEFHRDEPMPPGDRVVILADIKTALAEIRDMSLRLRPPLLDDAGLEAALRWYLERQSATGKFRFSLAVAGLAHRLPDAIEITAFRLVQEAVNNVVRHARAGHVEVTLNTTATELAVRVSDDGVGFDAREALSDACGGASLGVLGMNERAALVGGRCEIISMPGVGSVVLARLPLA